MATIKNNCLEDSLIYRFSVMGFVLINKTSYFPRKKRQLINSAVLLLLLSSLIGCASQKYNIPEKHFDSSEVQKIQENITSVDNVISLFGKPSFDNMDNRGNGQLLYVYKVDEGNCVKTKSLRLLIVGRIVKKCIYTEHIETDSGSTTNNSSGKLIPIKMIPF